MPGYPGITRPIALVVPLARRCALTLGLYLRTKDAVIARLGYTFRTTTAGMSYDLNTSKFIAATDRRGAFEIFITHIIKRNRPFIAKKRVCPVFM